MQKARIGLQACGSLLMMPAVAPMMTPAVPPRFAVLFVVPVLVLGLA